MTASVGIADPLLRRAFGRRGILTLDVLHEYASGPQGSMRVSQGGSRFATNRHDVDYTFCKFR